MAGNAGPASRPIEKRRFDQPQDELSFVHGRSLVVAINGSEEVWRSELMPGWNWDEDLKPYAGDLTSCPMTHREVVVSGRIRYLMTDGSEVAAEAGDVLFIPPGHRGWVVGDEPCVLIDW
jgi:hypothetical protein